jgi:ElaB/YqjD/DUF883 family membrane-anchored ribosome-binding protein
MFATTQRAGTSENTNGDVKDTAESIRTQARRVKGDVHEAVEAIKDDANHFAREAGHHVRDVIDMAQDNASDAATAVTAKIRQEPVTSTFIALGVGILLGFLFRR